jgi:hypothetical protein
MAAEVPTVRAIRSFVTAPQPTFAHAPSPIPGYHGILARSGHRPANAGRIDMSGVLAAMTGGSVDGSTPAAATIWPSHCAVWTLSMPVPEAIEIVVRSWP